MAKVIVYRRPDGGVTEAFLSPSDRLPGEPEGDWIARRIALERLRRPDVAAEAEMHVVDQETLRDKERWRDCWTVSGGSVVVDTPRARLLRAGELERRRGAAYDRLTALIQQADDDGKPAKHDRLKARRKALRELDLVAALASVSLEDLDAFAPAELAAAEQES